MRPAPPESIGTRSVRTARDCARELQASLALRDLEHDVVVEAEHPALAWARSGAMALTGDSDGPPLLTRGSLASSAAAALAVLRALAGPSWDGPSDGAALLGERAALLGLRRRGRVSAGGSCRLVPAADGWLALNLAREEDRALLPAWLEIRPRDFSWSLIAAGLREQPAEEWVARARLLGLPAAAAAAPLATPPPFVRLAQRGPALERRMNDPGFILDLSSLWAGPLCCSLLQSAGLRAVKLESLRRPDGSRSGPAAFFDLLHAGKASAALDLANPDGRAALRRLVERADIVIESSRPRALRQLGIEAEDWVHARPGRVWVSISGYGRMPPADGWVAFGDDAAAAAGLATVMGAPGESPRFCGDAIADPLAGLFAAAAALAAWRSGESRLLDVSLWAAAAAALGNPLPDGARMLGNPEGWAVEAGSERARVLAPRARTALGRARSLGADTREVLAEC